MEVIEVLNWEPWGVVNHSESVFLFITLQISRKMTYMPNFIKIGWKMPKLAFWDGWGGKSGVAEG